MLEQRGGGKCGKKDVNEACVQVSEANNLLDGQVGEDRDSCHGRSNS